MPNIPTYAAPTANLDPSERGSSAWGRAGSRIASFYNEAAGFTRKAGALDAATYRQKLWPFDILELYERKAAQRASEAAGIKPDAINLKIGKSRGTGTTGNRVTDGWTPGYNDLVTRGASALGRGLRDGGYVAAADEYPTTPHPGVTRQDLQGNTFGEGQIDINGNIRYNPVPNIGADQNKTAMADATAAGEKVRAIDEWTRKYNGDTGTVYDPRSQYDPMTGKTVVPYGSVGSVLPDPGPATPGFFSGIGSAIAGGFSDPEVTR